MAPTAGTSMTVSAAHSVDAWCHMVSAISQLKSRVWIEYDLGQGVTKPLCCNVAAFVWHIYAVAGLGRRSIVVWSLLVALKALFFIVA